VNTSSINIVGGGISGLSAAFEMHRRGAPFRLFEAADRFGGILRTEHVGELLIDAGPDAMLARKPAGVAICEELGIAERLVPAKPPRTAYVLRHGRLEKLLSLSSFGTVAANADARPDRETDFSIADYFREHYAAEALDYYAEPVLAGIHAGDVERLSMPALFPEMLSGESRARMPDPQGEFRSFPGGMQELVDALVAALPRAALHASARVPPLAELLAAGPTIVSVPARPAAAMFAPLDSELEKLCGGVRYVSSGIVVLAYPRRAVNHELAGSGFVVPRAERGFRILAATWLSSKWPNRAPEDMALMRAFFGGARDPDAMTLTDDALVALAHGDLARILDIDAPPSLARVYRWIDGTPQYEVGYLDRLRAIRERVASRRRLFVTGAAFGSIGIPDCIAAARQTAVEALHV
jgi:oxygen-dependent protoporphyrinogen oxidase